MFGRISIAGFCVLPLFLSACVTNAEKNPHNDVLIFGTSTKFALDVSAAVQNAGIPEFTFGYKRLEAVWMPLKPQGAGTEFPGEMSALVAKLQNCDTEKKADIPDAKTRNVACLRMLLPPDKYVSMSSGVDSKTGGTTLEIDSYSVFASLGANGSLTGNSAGGSLAQFFATGVAAQRLGANPGISMVLNADAPEAALKIAKESEDKDVLERREGIKSDVDVATACVKGWKGNPPDDLEHPTAKSIATKFHEHEKLESFVKGNPAARDAIIKACPK